MKKAFTLIELLVVIAIIAILAAILFPVFAQAKAAAKKTASLSNFKQIALGTMMYSGDADDTFPVRYIIDAKGTDTYPPHRESWAALSWRELTGPYIKNGISNVTWVLKTGEVPAGTTGPWADGGIWESPVRPKVYGIIDMHEYLGTGGKNGASDPYAPLSQTSLKRPADTLLLAEKGVNPEWNSPGGNFEMNWWGYANRDGSWPPRLKGNGDPIEGDNNVWPNWCVPRYRHGANATTTAFADGHAKTLNKGKLNWCRMIHVEGMDPGQEWVYDNGNPCAGEER